jgi:basic amino acid/polyamine antiporter, APA family
MAGLAATQVHNANPHGAPIATVVLGMLGYALMKLAPPSMVTPRTDDSLVRVMGTFGLAAAIVNITIGGGIFRLPANVAESLGAAAPIAYLVCAVAMGLIVLCIADAGSRVSLTGGPYAYVGTAFGPYAGFLAGVLLWMLGTFAAAAVSTVFAASVGLLVPALGGSMQVVVLIVAFAFWSFINLRGVALAARFNSIATVAKLLPLLLVAIGGAFFVRTENLQWLNTPPAADVARTSLLLIFAFAGIEVALVPSGEVRDTARTVPRAIALAMIGITALYIALQVVSQGILGTGLATATASPLADVAGASMGEGARLLLLAGASISMFGYLGGMTLSMPRTLFAFARDGFLPKMFATVHAEFRSPHLAILAQSIITVALAVSGTFERLAILANVSALALYLGCALAAWRLRVMGVAAHGGSGFRVPFGPLVPWLACGVIAWLLTGLNRGEWLAFGGCVAVASLIYMATRGQRATALRLDIF